MPDTEQLELRTDTVEELIDRLDYDIVGRSNPMSRSRRQAVQDRLRRQTSKPDAIAFCGLPGAGKSYTAEKAADVYDATVVSMGDAIREQYDEQHGGAHDSYDSDDLGDFAAQWRDDDPKAIPAKVVDIARRKHRQEGHELVIIDGVRSATDYEVLNDYFDDFYLIEVEAEFYKRLDRLTERGREGEETFTAVDLAERDEHERNNLGFGELQDTVYIDMNIKNETGPDKLAISLSSVVENNLPFEIQNGKPLGLDSELEKRRKVMAGGGPV
jgi:dephospho-CoA kinase